MPGMSLSLCICLSCLPRRPAAADVDIVVALLCSCEMVRDLEGGFAELGFGIGFVIGFVEDGRRQARWGFCAFLGKNVMP